MLKGNKYKITALLIVMAMLATCVLTGCGEKKTMSMGDDVNAFVENIDMDYAYDVTSDLQMTGCADVRFMVCSNIKTDIAA